MPERLLALQRTAGNRAVAQSIQRWDWRDIADPLGVTSAIGGVIGFITAGAVEQRQFKAAVHAARGRPVWRAEWDAWGHALCAASSAGFGGEGHAWAFGEGAELTREALRGLQIMDHDSYEQDTHNQAVGRQLATQNGAGGASLDELVRACTGAYLQGRMLVGPEREDAWLPWCGGNDYVPVRHHEDRDWIPESDNWHGDPGLWTEAVDPGPRGLAVGSGRHPSTPLPQET